jgi:uncharacterized cupin superfamily protein
VTARPSCVINVAEIPGEPRPRMTATPGVAAVLRSPGDKTGLTHMGVHVRTIQPGLAGTNRHFHTVEEEWAYVLGGTGTVRIGPLRIAVRPGSFVGFPAGPRPHHFLAEGTEPLVLLEGGERRPGDDSFWYPDLRRMGLRGKLAESYQEPPPEQGDAAQVVHCDEVPVQDFRHDLDSAVRRRMRTLHAPTGLVRQAVRIAEVAAGGRSTVLHSHSRTDEWLFILAGRARVRVGDDAFEAGPADFLGHAAGSPPHEMTALEALTYLVGGEIDAADVVTYPEAGKRRVGGRLEPLRD